MKNCSTMGKAMLIYVTTIIINDYNFFSVNYSYLLYNTNND